MNPYEELAERYNGIEFSPCPGRPKYPPLYQFPATRYITNSPWRQWWHLLSEVLEIGRALATGNLQHAATEAWDVKHSAETLHRILAGQGCDVELAREAVLGNNLERGYYD